MTESNFEWDSNKERANIATHGVSVFEAQFAFKDPKRVIAEDAKHSDQEDCYFCFGLNQEKQAFSLSDSLIAIPKSESLVQATGVKVKRFMKNPIKYKDEDIGEPLIISDFLPSPEELKLKSERKKVTLSLSKESVDFFKAMADENGLQYQVIIRTLLDDYVSHQKRIDE